MPNENEIYEVLASYKEALDHILENMAQMEQEHAQEKEQLNAKIHELESILFDEVLNPARKAMDDAAKEEKFTEFLAKHGEKFAPIDKSIRAVEGPDFDVVRKVFDDYEASDKSIPEDEYVDNVYNNLADQVEKIKEAFGAETVEVKADEDGIQEVKADDEDVTEEVKEMAEGEDPEVKAEVTEEEVEAPAEEKTEEPKEEVIEEEEEDSPDEIEALMKELEAYKD